MFAFYLSHNPLYSYIAFLSSLRLDACSLSLAACSLGLGPGASASGAQIFFASVVQVSYTYLSPFKFI